jgi:hypothetical protein
VAALTTISSGSSAESTATKRMTTDDDVGVDQATVRLSPITVERVLVGERIDVCPEPL